MKVRHKTKVFKSGRSGCGYASWRKLVYNIWGPRANIKFSNCKIDAAYVTLSLSRRLLSSRSLVVNSGRRSGVVCDDDDDAWSRGSSPRFTVKQLLILYRDA